MPKAPPGTCIICLSPFRDEIIKLFKNKVKMADIYTKYSRLMAYKSTQYSFYVLIKRHIDNKHLASAMVIQTERRINSIDEFGRKMLELGMIKLDTLSPEQVELKDVVAAQKLVLESKKLKITEDAMAVMLGKLFGPRLAFGDVIEGEVGN